MPRYRTLTEQSEDGIMLTNVRGVILDANARACQMLGYTREELLYSSALRLLHPDDIEGRRLRPETPEACVDPGPIRRMRRKDGTFILVEGARRRGLHSSQSTLILRDISDRTRAEEARGNRESLLQVAVRSARAVAWEWDLATGEVRWSEGAESTLGLAPGSLGGTEGAALEAVLPEDRRKIARTLDRVRRGEAEPLFEVRMVRADGGVLRALFSGRDLRDADGNPIKFTGILIDITPAA